MAAFRSFFRAGLTGLACALMVPVGGLRAEETALDRYVKKPDNTYAWKVVNKVEAAGTTQFVVELVSQTWRNSAEVNRPVWKHWLVITKPNNAKSDTAFLFISGGANRDSDKPPTGADGRTLAIAKATGGVTAELKMVPNQTLQFLGDGVNRTEDDLIGFTWDQYLKTGDETWPARLPMTKSAVRAMDCMQELLASDEGGKLKLEKFVVSGGSKRGWTTWTTAAVDKRVVAIIPAVIDVLNLRDCMRNHLWSFGFYTHSVGDYVRHNIMQRMDDPRIEKLYEIEDPWSYRDRLTMPKYIVNSAGDQFFCPDSSQFYFNGLPGEKHLRYVPNTDHSLRDSDATECLAAFYHTVQNGNQRPQYSWSFEGDNSIKVVCATKPKEVKLWKATNPKARDFRLEKIGKAYTSVKLEDQGDGVYVGKVEKPAEGWTAYFVEMTFPSGLPLPLKVTSGCRIIPEILPFKNLDPAKGPLEPEPKR
jgi:PhoPQ-activated pathogenicity-related protein